MKAITGAQHIYNGLVKQNVKHIWLYSGGSIMPLIDCFKDKKIKYYVPTSEQNAGHAATGYAKSTSETGVVITTSGPGITNMITPMLDAQNDSTPMVVISGQVSVNSIGTDAFQEAPATELTKTFTKWSHCVKNPGELKDIINTAFFIANNKKKGVVHIDVPKCVLTSKVNFTENYINENYKKHYTNSYMPPNIDYEFSHMIDRAEKPIIVLGQGAKHASKEILELVEKNNIPCTSTIHGKGILPDSHRLSLHWCGMHGSPAANIALQQSDCIIAIGSRFDDRTTGLITHYAPIARNKRQVIHVDIEMNQFNKALETDYNIQCDSKDFLEHIIPRIEFNTRTGWCNIIKELKESHKFIPMDSNFLTVPYVIKSINKIIKDKRNVKITTGVGNHQMMTYQYIDAAKPNMIHSSGSLGVMGSSIGYAQGVQIGNPDDLVISIDGDSSFMMTGCDLKTIRENNLPIKIAIMNDGRQSMVHTWEKLFFDENHVATINKENPSFITLARAFGIDTYLCASKKMCHEATYNFLNSKGPALCEYFVEGEVCLPLVSPGRALDDMITHENYYEDRYFNINNVPS